MGKLDNKHCVITGAAGSVGFATAKLFVEEGATVTLVDRNSDNLLATEKALSSYLDRLAFIEADVTESSDTRNYIEESVGRWGKIDVLFSNAGLSGDCKPIVDYPEDVFDAVMSVNVKASFLACKYAIPQMNDGGSIIITSSIMGVKANPNIVAYATSKHAVIGLMKVVAHEVAPRKIRANVLAPGPIDNEFQTNIENELGAAMGINATDFINQMIPLKRHARAEEIARSALFLASDESSFSTGSVLMADGGLNA